MNTHDKYELPRLPTTDLSIDINSHSMKAMESFSVWTESQMKSYARAAIEADRQRQADWHRIADERAAEIVRLEGELDRKRRGEQRVIGRIKLDGNRHPRAELSTGYDENGDQWKEGTPIYAAPQPTEPVKALAAQAQQPVSGAESLPGFRVDLDEAQEDRLKTWVGHAEASPWRQSVTRLALLLNTTKRGLIDYDAAHHFAQELMTRTGRAALAQQDADHGEYVACVQRIREASGMLDPLDEIRSICDEQPHDALTRIARVLGFGDPAEPVSPHPDDAAVDAFAVAMKAKLAKKRTEGRGNWQMCTSTYLSRLLREHVEKGDPVDVANLAMMLSLNGQRIAPDEPVKVSSDAVAKDAERYRKFIGAGLPITYLGEDYRDKSSLDAAIDATGEP